MGAGCNYVATGAKSLAGSSLTREMVKISTSLIPMKVKIVLNQTFQELWQRKLHFTHIELNYCREINTPLHTNIGYVRAQKHVLACLLIA